MSKSLSQHSILLIQINEVDLGNFNEEIDPEVKLWRRVLVQALQDATVPVWAASCNVETSVERASALAFIFTSVGVTADHFDRTCSFADVEKEKFRGLVAQYIKEDRRFFLRLPKNVETEADQSKKV